jgi:Ca-activated chloride channel homolog
MLIMRSEASKAGNRLLGRGVAALAGAGVIAGALAGAAPPPPPTPEATFGEEVAVAWILVPVTVKRRGAAVRGLSRRDFELRVDGRPVAFADFEARGEVSWSLLFVQDLSGSMALEGRLDASQRAVVGFLDAARPGDEFALASFAGRTTTVDVPFTEDQQALRESVAQWEAWGRTALHDAVALIPRISGRSRNLKRAAVLITDGVDNASRVRAAAARELVRRAELPVYVLGFGSGDPFALSRQGEKVYRYADVLNLLAALTGGRYFALQGPAEVAAACAAIAEELRYQYVLGFETRGTGESRYRSISVAVRGRQLEVSHRKGYHGKAPAP